jgi:hypothetical protein
MLIQSLLKDAGYGTPALDTRISANGAEVEPLADDERPFKLHGEFDVPMRRTSQHCAANSMISKIPKSIEYVIPTSRVSLAGLGETNPV